MIIDFSPLLKRKHMVLVFPKSSKKSVVGSLLLELLSYVTDRSPFQYVLSFEHRFGSQKCSRSLKDEGDNLKLTLNKIHGSAHW